MTPKQTLSHLILGKRGGQNRVQMIELLRERPYNMNQLATVLKLNYRTVKYHMEVLQKNGLVTVADMGGKTEFYHLTSDMEGNLELFDTLTKKFSDMTTSPTFFRNVIRQTSDAVIIIDTEMETVFLNESAERLFGFKEEKVLGYKIPAFMDERMLENKVREVMRKKQSISFEITGMHSSSESMDLSVTMDAIMDDGGQVIGTYILSRDITARKRAEERQNLLTNILELLNRPVGKTDVIKEILLQIKGQTRFDAVGLRLKEGDDFPYYETSGFPATFLRSESSLCSFDGTGKPNMGDDGKPILDCMCGTVIRGRTDPSLPHFTEYGSFWTNSSTEFLSTAVLDEGRGKIRGTCNKEGFESIALIPLMSDNEVIGLLQIDDKRPDMFDPEMIDFFERLGESIGIAIARKRWIEDLSISRERFLLASKVANIGSWDWDIVSGGLEWSETIEPMFGFAEGKFGGTYEDFLECVHPDDRAHVVDSVNACVDKGEDYDIEHRIVWPDGTIRWVSETGNVFRDEKGKAIRMLGIVKDITHKKGDE